MALHAESNDEHVDLVIIGGGPTGLLCAVLARQLGISVSVIDAKAGPLDLGRADALNARTQQYLEVVGILDELLPQGITCNTSSTYADGVAKSRQSQWWTGIEYCFRRNFLMIGQPVVESVLTNRLDTPVHYSESAVSVSEDDTSVTVTTDSGRVVRGKYAIAADGARSGIRKAIGIDFAGTKPEMVWAVLDTFLDTDFPVCHEIITFQLNGQSRVSWIPRERGMARFYVLLDGEITQERAENSIKDHLAPYRVEFTKTEWFSTFEVKERIASTFVSNQGSGRVILAGDSAHVHSVNGGQGLNTGIADAFGLTWRVATAVRNASLAPGAAARLIRSYDTERRAVAQDVINVAAKLVRDTMHTAEQYVSTIEKNAGYITGMGVSYNGTGSELITESEHGIWKAGCRCPDLLLTELGTGVSKSVYSLLPYGQFAIFHVGGQQGSLDHLHEVATCFSIHSSTHEQGTGSAGSTSRDFTSEHVVAEDQFAIVVRPDMYIGYVGDSSGCSKYMANLYAY